MSIPITHSTRVQSPESRVQSRFYTIPFLGVFMLSALWSLRNVRSILSRVLRLFPEHCSDTFLIATAHLHGQCGQRLPLCQSCFAVVFYQRKHLSCSILCVRHDVLLAFVPAPANDVYTVQFFVSPAIVLYIFRPHVGFVFSVNYSMRIERNVLLIQTLPLPGCCQKERGQQ